MLPRDVASYGRRVSERLYGVLRDDLIGVYFVGSIALGGYVAGESDIDIAAVTERGLDDEKKRMAAGAVLETTTSCPARGLEFSLYRREVVRSPTRDAAFEVNVNGGPRMDSLTRLDPGGQPGFWYVIDRAIAHRCGQPILGPPPAELFAEVPRPVLLQAMTDSVRWHRRHEKATLYSVLNAARAWRYAAEGVLGSKLEGATWAAERWSEPALIEAAVDLRHGRPAPLDAAAVERLLGHVERELVQASG